MMQLRLMTLALLLGIIIEEQVLSLDMAPYNIARDPLERHNLAYDPASAGQPEEMRLTLAGLLQSTGANPDVMPIDQGIKAQLPEESIR